MLIEKIKQDQLQARKNKELLKSTLLSTLIGEASLIGKNDGNRETTDQEVFAVIRKFLKGINESINYITNAGGTLALITLNSEKQILESYQPKQLDQDELTSIINQIIEDLSVGGDIKMGQVLQKLKLNFEGQYDGALASKITKESLG